MLPPPLMSLWGWWLEEFGVHSVEGTISRPTFDPLLCLWVSFCLVPVFITALLIVLVLSNVSAGAALNLYSSHRRRKDTFGIDANPLDMWNWRETLFHLWGYSAWLPHSFLTHLLPVNECYIASYSNWHTFHLHDIINKSLVQDDIVAISLPSTPGHPQDRTALTFLCLPSSWHQQTFHLYLS